LIDRVRAAPKRLAGRQVLPGFSAALEVTAPTIRGLLRQARLLPEWRPAPARRLQRGCEAIEALSRATPVLLQVKPVPV
jgi:hypothetical protein